MARTLYINPDPTTQSRATELGCGWMPAIPNQFAGIATAPCVILSGAGTTIVLQEPTTQQAVAAALQPILNAEAAAAAAQASQAANAASLQGKAQAALAANSTFQAIASPTNAQVLAQVQLLTKECNALIRLALNLLDTTSDT